MRIRTRVPQVLALLVLLASTQSVSAATPASAAHSPGPSTSVPGAEGREKAAAQKIYVQGTAHFKAGRFLEALAAFRASYDRVPSANSHLMIARTLREHGDLADAYLEFEKVVPEAQTAAERDAKYKPTVSAALAEREGLRAELTLLTVVVKKPPPGVRVLVGDRPVDPAMWGQAFPILPGAVVVRALLPDATERRQELVGASGGALVATLDFAPELAPTPEEVLPSPFPTDHTPVASSDASSARENPPDIPRQPRPTLVSPDRTLAYVSLGVGAVGFATFSVFGLMNEATYSDLREVCANGHCSPDQRDNVEKGRRQQVIANVALGVSAAATLFGIVLVAVGPADRPGEVATRGPDRENHAPVRLTDIRVDGHSMSLGGTF